MISDKKRLDILKYKNEKKKVLEGILQNLEYLDTLTEEQQYAHIKQSRMLLNLHDNYQKYLYLKSIDNIDSEMNKLFPK